MEDLFNWLTTTPWGLAAVVFGLMILFALYAFLSERKTRRLYPDQDRRGTKAVAKKKAQMKTAKSSVSKSSRSNKTPISAEKPAEVAKPTNANKTTSTKKTSGKPTPKASTDDETFSLEGFFETLWGDEETGKKGLFESLWEDDEEDAQPTKSTAAGTSKGKPQKKQTTAKTKSADTSAKEPEE